MDSRVMPIDISASASIGRPASSPHMVTGTSCRSAASTICRKARSRGRPIGS